MRRITLTILAALLTALLPGCTPRHLVGDGFEVQFPTTPKVGQDVKQTPRGPITLHEAAARDGTMAFIVSYCAQPGSTTFEEAVKGSIAGVSQYAKVLRVEPRPLVGRPSHMVIFTVPSTLPKMPSAVVRSHLLLADSRLYTVVVLAYDEASLFSPKAEAFVASFRLRPAN